MEKKFKIGVIGAGYMASSIINGAISSGKVSPQLFLVSDKCQENLDKLSKIGVSTTTDNSLVANSCEFVLFAIKPQNFNEVLMQMKDCECKKFISIMAGVKKQTIKNGLGDVKVARCMPNAPCLVKSGAVGIDCSDYNDKNDIDFIKSIFEGSSAVIDVQEKDLNVVTGISGSAPAYFYFFAKGLIEAGVKNGLSVDQATSFVVNTMIGSGKMLLNCKDKTIDELIDSVCSKGGTTIEAIKVYKENQLDQISDKAVDACVKRAFELENL